MNVNTRVCDSCIDTAADEGLDRNDEAANFCVEWGSELADHLCEEIELSGETRCNCGCHPLEKQRLRALTAKAGAG